MTLKIRLQSPQSPTILWYSPTVPTPMQSALRQNHKTSHHIELIRIHRHKPVSVYDQDTVLDHSNGHYLKLLKHHYRRIK